MKIALVSPYDFAYPGGVVNHISSLERHLTLMGHQVRIIAPASKAVDAFGDRFISIGSPRPIPTSGSIARVTLSPWLSRRVKTMFAEENFDIIHLHEPLIPMLCTTVLRLSQTVNVGTFHADGGEPGYKLGWPVTTFFLKKWFRKLSARIAVSETAREFVNKSLPAEYEIIPNGVSLEHFSPDVSPISEFCDNKLNILFVGRLERRKGLIHLLESYRQLKQDFQNIRLIIVGPGKRLRHKYEKMVSRNDLKDVHFIGYISYEDLPRYYQTADIYCSPATDHESFGIVLLEAMAMGKPIVASNISGYARVVSHGVEGLLVPPRNPQALTEALSSLITDASLRRQMGASGQIKAQQYSWGQIVRKILGVYCRVLNRPWEKEMAEIEITRSKLR